MTLYLECKKKLYVNMKMDRNKDYLKANVDIYYSKFNNNSGNTSMCVTLPNYTYPISGGALLRS